MSLRHKYDTQKLDEFSAGRWEGQIYENGEGGITGHAIANGYHFFYRINIHWDDERMVESAVKGLKDKIYDDSLIEDGFSVRGNGYRVEARLLDRAISSCPVCGESYEYHIGQRERINRGTICVGEDRIFVHTQGGDACDSEC